MSIIKNISISVTLLACVLICFPVSLQAQQCPPQIDTQAYSTCEGRLQQSSYESGGEFYFEMIDNGGGGIDFSWFESVNCLYVTSGTQLRVPADGKTYLCVASVSGNVCNYFYFSAVATPPPPAPESNNPHVQTCSAGSSTLEIINQGRSYTWKESSNGIILNSDGNGQLASGHSYVLNSAGTSLLIYHGDGPLSFSFDVTYGNSSVLHMTLSVLTPPSIAIVEAEGVSEACPGTESEFKIADLRDVNLYNWSLSPSNAGSISSSGIVTWSPSGFSGNATVKLNATATICNNYHMEDEVTVIVHPSPATPNEVNLHYCDFELISLTVPGVSYSFNWYDNENNFLKSGYEYTVASKPEGNYTYMAEYINEFGCVSESKFPINIAVTSSCDENLNYIETISYDVGEANENQPKIAHSKSYYDNVGKLLQTQARSFTESSILATQTLDDQYGRAVLATLPAPTLKSNFQYIHRFVRNSSSSDIYDVNDFDSPTTTINPAKVGDQLPGTLGWYYSENNTGEDHVPTTGYPYSRTEFYQDGTGEIKRSAGPGDQHRMGANHEMLSGTFPVYHELDDYLAIRRNPQQVNLPDNLNSASLLHSGVQSVVRDQNGNYSINITDKSGKTVMSARKGTSSENALTVTNTITSTVSDPEADTDMPLTYLYILDEQTVTISPGDYTIEDLITGAPYTPVDNVWKAGFYRVILTSGSVTLSYSNYFLDVSYQFYDDAGRLKASVSPNGFEQLKNGVSYSDVDKTTYNYNHQGWLMSMSEPDAGTTDYLYCRDGKIKFSRNAEQIDRNTFSYTGYDPIGRPIESGEYVEDDYTFDILSTSYFLDYGYVPWGEFDTKDWVKTYYDFPDESIPNLPSTFQQTFVAGAVSYTENINIKSWYSYDEQGRVVWMAQNPKQLNRTFVTQYTYDFLGNVKEVKNASYVSGSPIEEFYHHYEYDADSRLSKAYTSLDGSSSSKKLRATYQYYQHGPLKRIELGNRVQGIDFVYNINGWLTQINHPDHQLDPGKDGRVGSNSEVRPDVFGMVIDYYESTLSNLYSIGSSKPLHDPRHFHDLPMVQMQEQYAFHLPLIRFDTYDDVAVDARPFKKYSAENSVQEVRLLKDSKNADDQYLNKKEQH